MLCLGERWPWGRRCFKRWVGGYGWWMLEGMGVHVKVWVDVGLVTCLYCPEIAAIEFVVA